MNKPPLTLSEIRKSEKISPRHVGVADLIPKKELEELRVKQAKAAHKKKCAFDDTDAYVAEIIARFGYDAYQAWNKDQIGDTKMKRLILAERARERQQWLPIEALLRCLIQGGIPTFQIKKPSKAAKKVQEILHDEVKVAKGEF